MQAILPRLSEQLLDPRECMTALADETLTVHCCFANATKGLLRVMRGCDRHVQVHAAALSRFWECSHCLRDIRCLCGGTHEQWGNQQPHCCWKLCGMYANRRLPDAVRLGA